MVRIGLFVTVSTSCICLDMVLLPFVMGTVHLVFRSFSEENDLYIAITWCIHIKDFALPSSWTPLSNDHILFIGHKGI